MKKHQEQGKQLKPLTVDSSNTLGPLFETRHLFSKVTQNPPAYNRDRHLLELYTMLKCTVHTRYAIIVTSSLLWVELGS